MDFVSYVDPPPLPRVHQLEHSSKSVAGRSLPRRAAPKHRRRGTYGLAASPQQKSPNIISPIRFDIPKSIPMNAEDEFEQDLISSGYYERMERLTHALKEQRALRDKFKNKKMPTIDKIGRKELSRIIKSTFQDLHHVDEIGTDYDPKLGSVFEALEDYAYPNKFNNDEKEFIKARFKAIQTKLT